MLVCKTAIELRRLLLPSDATATEMHGSCVWGNAGVNKPMLPVIQIYSQYNYIQYTIPDNDNKWLCYWFSITILHFLSLFWSVFLLIRSFKSDAMLCQQWSHTSCVHCISCVVLRGHNELHVVVNNYNPSTWKAEGGGFWVWGSLGRTVSSRPVWNIALLCFKKQEKDAMSSDWRIARGLV
jgi:hypothetical protein